MPVFIDAQRLASSQTATQIPTGSPQLDELTGGIRAQTMFLFYGENELIETLYMHLLANSLKPTPQEPKPEAIIIICRNYRVEHITMDTEQLTSLLEATGQSTEDAPGRRHHLSAAQGEGRSLQLSLRSQISGNGAAVKGV